jgi:hypothetical protein
LKIANNKYIIFAKTNQTNITKMRIKLLLILACMLMACEKHEEGPQPITKSVLGIEQITINNNNYPINEGFMIENCKPLITTGSYNSSTKLELNYAWNALAEDLSSVSITSTKGQVEVNWTENTTSKTCTVRVYSTNPKAENKIYYNSFD